MAGLRLVDKDSRGDYLAVLAEPEVARSSLWSALVDASDGALRTAVLDAAADLLEDAGDDDRHPLDVLREHGVDALDGALARRLVKVLRDGGWTALGDLDAALATVATDSATAGLDDVLAGPIAVLDAAGQGHAIRVALPSDFWDRSATVRRRWLAWLADLGAGLRVDLAAGPIDRRRLVDDHSAVLPGSVSRRAQQGGPRGVALDALADGLADSPAWSVLAVLDDTGAERAPLSALCADVRTGDVTDSAVRHRVGRLAGLGLVDRVDVDGERHIALTAAGSAAVRLHREEGTDAPSPTADRPHAHTDGSAGDDGSGVGAADETPAVSDPPNPSDGTVDAYAGTGSPPGREDRTDDRGRPDAEAVVAGDDDAAAAATPEASARWLPLHRHHAAAAAAHSGDVVLDDCRDGSLLDRDSPGDYGVSTDLDRREVVVSIRYDSTLARTAVRLAAALASDRVAGRVLTDDRLGDRLDGLADGNLPVLRLARQLGWLPDDGADPTALRQRLGAARRRLLADAAEVGSGDTFDGGLASDVLRRAHGLAGVVSHVLDLLGFDLVRVVDVPDAARNVVDDRGAAALGEWVAHQTAISARYGHYSAFRVLFEDRPDRRQAMLGAPVVDDPRGDLIGSWVIRGPGADRLAPELELSQWLDVVDDDRRNAARFLLDVDLADADRREVVAEVVARLGSFKGLSSTRSAVSLLHALVSPWGAAEALGRLGRQDPGTERPVLLDEVRLGLAGLDAERLLPHAGKPGVSAVLSVLLGADGPLSKGDLARLGDVSRPTVSTALDLLDGLGLVDVDDRGAGRADRVKVKLPDKSDRGDDDAPRPALLDDAAAAVVSVPDAALRLVDAVAGADLVSSGLWSALVDGRIDLVSLRDRWPRLAGLLEPAARLLGVDDDRLDDRLPPGPWSASTALGAAPEGRQLAIGRSGGWSDGRDPYPSGG